MRVNVGWIWGAAAAFAAACAPAAAPSAARLVEDLRARAVEPSEVDRLAALLRECEAAGLPMESLAARLQEGIAKNASNDGLVRAMESRARALRLAYELSGGAGVGHSGGGAGRDLLVSLAGALESGVAEAALREAVGRSGGGAAYRLQAVVECGEGLHLAGMEADGVRTFMLDCLSRDLGRMEILRASRFVMQRLREGAPWADALKELWGADPSGGRGRGRRHGGGRGEP